MPARSWDSLQVSSAASYNDSATLGDGAAWASNKPPAGSCISLYSFWSQEGARGYRHEVASLVNAAESLQHVVR